MKRMNLKKAISLVTFLLLMVFGLQAQNMNSETATVTVKQEIESLTALNQGAAALNASNDEAIVTSVKIAYLENMVDLLHKYGTVQAVNQTYTKFAANATGSRLALINGVKQDVVTLLTE